MNTRIALDAMGGDHAPAATVAGALFACAQFSVDVALVGREELIWPELAKHGPVPPGITVVHAAETIEMDEHPTQAVRAKRDSSIAVGLRMVKSGEARGFVSSGNTGAAMATALLVLGRIAGVERPAVGALIPRPSGGVTLLVDAGANAESRASHMVQFAQMGSAYSERVLGVPRPRVGLLNIGEEATKGSPFIQEVYELLESAPSIQFVGNVEGQNLSSGAVDVIVTDGFTGNIILKTAEGIIEVVEREMRQALTSHWYYLPAALLLRPAFRRMVRKFDYGEFGGGPLLGVDGAVIISHGRSDAKAIANSIRVAAEGARSGMREVLQDLFAEVPAGMKA